jgi:hypothetical protein
VKTILFDSRDSFLVRQSLMHDYFQKNPERNIIPVSVFHDYEAYKEYQYLGNTELLASFWEKGRCRYDKPSLCELEEKYDIINFWNIVASDRFIKNRKEQYIIEQISFYIYAWETIIDKYKPDYIVTETIAGLWNYVLYFICRHNNIVYLSIQTTKNTGRYYFSRDQFGSWNELEKRYDELLSKGLNKDETLIASDFIQNFQKKPLVPPFMKFMAAFPNFIKFINFPRFFINLRKDIIQNWIHKNHDYKLGYRLSEYGLTIKYASRILYSKLMNLFEKPDLDGNYILYPLHFQPEATTDIWAPYYSDQLFTIKSIARSLPFGFYLYVKEHSAKLGSKPIRFYRDIHKIPNIRFIDPFSSIYDLINNSKAVIVITSTTGLESILLNKPTIVLGNVFYNIYPFVKRVHDINDLPHIIKEALYQKVNNTCPERLAFAYLYSIMGYKSDIYTYRPDEQEIVCFIDELLEEISKQ